MARPYEPVFDNHLYIRSHSRLGIIDDDDDATSLLCEKLQKAGPLALVSESAMIVAGVWAVDFRRSLALWVESTSLALKCFKCARTLRKDYFHLPDTLHRRLALAHLASFDPGRDCDLHPTTTRVVRCKHCNYDEPPPPQDWMVEDEDNEILVRDVDEDEAVAASCGEVILLFHQCRKNVSRVRLTHHKGGLVTYTTVPTATDGRESNDVLATNLRSADGTGDGGSSLNKTAVTRETQTVATSRDDGVGTVVLETHRAPEL